MIELSIRLEKHFLIEVTSSLRSYFQEITLLKTFFFKNVETQLFKK
jgi:hypothetical protein